MNPLRPDEIGTIKPKYNMSKQSNNGVPVEIQPAFNAMYLQQVSKANIEFRTAPVQQCLYEDIH